MAIWSEMSHTVLARKRLNRVKSFYRLALLPFWFLSTKRHGKIPTDQPCLVGDVQ